MFDTAASNKLSRIDKDGLEKKRKEKDTRGRFRIEVPRIYEDKRRKAGDQEGASKSEEGQGDENFFVRWGPPSLPAAASRP